MTVGPVIGMGFALAPAMRRIIQRDTTIASVLYEVYFLDVGSVTIIIILKSGFWCIHQNFLRKQVHQAGPKNIVQENHLYLCLRINGIILSQLVSFKGGESIDQLFKAELFPKPEVDFQINGCEPVKKLYTFCPGKTGLDVPVPVTNPRKLN